MPKKKTSYVVVQITVSIPRAGEFVVGLPIAEDVFLDPPTKTELEAYMLGEASDRLRVKIARDEHKRVIKKLKTEPR